MALNGSSSSSLRTLLLLTLIVAGVGLAAGGKRPVHIPDELDDVVDDEEDEAWKEWGKKKSALPAKFDPPPTDFAGMKLPEIQEEMLKRHTGPAFGFVKLRLGVRRSPGVVGEIAMKWTKILRTGGLEANFMVVDLSTVMFTMPEGQDIRELKEFILNEAEEAYEVKIGDQVFRRPGDPPLEDVLRNEKYKENGHAREDL